MLTETCPPSVKACKNLFLGAPCCFLNITPSESLRRVLAIGMHDMHLQVHQLARQSMLRGRVQVELWRSVFSCEIFRVCECQSASFHFTLEVVTRMHRELLNKCRVVDFKLHLRLSAHVDLFSFCLHDVNRGLSLSSIAAVRALFVVVPSLEPALQ